MQSLNLASTFASWAQQAPAADEYPKTFPAPMLDNAGGEIDTQETVQEFPLKLTSVREYATRVLATQPQVV